MVFTLQRIITDTVPEKNSIIVCGNRQKFPSVSILVNKCSLCPGTLIERDQKEATKGFCRVIKSEIRLNCSI